MRALERLLVGGVGARTDLGDESVPAQRQVGPQDEGGSAAPDPVDLSGNSPVLGLRELTDLTALELDAHPHPGAVGNVDGHSGLHATARDNGGGERLPPRSVLDIPQGALDLLIGAGAHAERGEHGLEGGT